MDLLDLLAEQESGPLPCPHAYSVNIKASGQSYGYGLELDPDSPYYLEWVHTDPACRRSTFPGQHKSKAPTMGWSRELQKDVPL